MIKNFFNKKKYTACNLILAVTISVVCTMFVMNKSVAYGDEKTANNISGNVVAMNLQTDIRPSIEPMVLKNEPKVTTVSEEPIIEPEVVLTQEEINLIALVVMAEAEGESELGQRLVIDTILNRVDHSAKYLPDTVTEVIYQKDQFTSMWNGRADRCYVKPELVELVKEELISRTNYDVIFFRTTHYSQYGTPMFQEGHHYFSSL